MREKRFNVEESTENRLIIYDNQGIDDYYHLGNDERDVKALCEMLNEFHDDNLQLKSLLKEAEEEIEALKESNKGFLESLVEHEAED